MLAAGGLVDWLLNPFGLGSPGFGLTATVVTLAYLWLPSMILPMLFPAVVAGSIFTFSLSVGDYIAVRIVGGTNQMLGNVVYDSVGAANNLPFGAAVATVPVVVMLAYLAAVRRTGALENL